MPFEASFTFNGKKYYTTNSLFNSDGLTIALSKNDIASLSNKELIKVLRFYQSAADEMEVIGLANEFHWSLQYLTPEKLLTIINSEFSSEAYKQKAKELLNDPYKYTQEKTIEIKSKKINRGYIYLLRSLHNPKNYKIGLSKKVKDRVKQIGDSELLHSFPADDMVNAEGILHGKFYDKRAFGEWFNLSDDDVTYIKNISEFCNGKFK